MRRVKSFFQNPFFLKKDDKTGRKSKDAVSIGSEIGKDS